MSLRGAVEGAFRSMYIETIGERPDEDIVAAAVEELVSKSAGAPVLVEAIRGSVTGLPVWKAKYREIATRVYRILCEGRIPDEATLSGITNIFAADPSYGLDELARDIRSGVVSSGASRKLEGPSDQAVAAPSAPSAPSDPEPASPPASAPSPDTAGDGRRQAFLGFLKRWRQATGRRADVYEFVRYFYQPGGGLSAADMQAAALGIDDSHASVSHFYRAYLSSDLSREAFLERYVFEHDGEGFEEAVADEVLGGDVYRDRMSAHISKTYQRVFATDLHPDDLLYVFGAVRGRRLPLHSEEVCDLVIDANKQLQKIADDTGDVFRDVLGRDPDADEVRERVNPYRQFGGEAAMAELWRSLHDSLEFHDVLKARIRARLEAERGGRAPSQKEVFDRLREVLHAHAKDMTKALAGV